MPQKRNNETPPATMTWMKAVPVLAVCVVFDALRFLFNQFWFFGPALAALYCTSKVSGVIGTTVGEAACSTAAGVAGYFGFFTVEMFGVIMAIAVGLFGWMLVGLIIIKTNARIFKENVGNTLWFMGSLFISEIPLVGSVPALSGVVWRMYSVQIKKEKAALKKYEEERAAQQLQGRRQQAAELMQMSAVQQFQANKAEYEAMEEAAVRATANDNAERTAETEVDEEIPDEVRKAA